MGRPKIEIDGEQVFKLAQLGCRNTEIADYFGCSEQTIESRFQPELDKGRAELRMSLRRWQLEAAKKGNVAMMIWLGKQILNQKDKHEMSSDEEKGFVMHIKDYADKKKHGSGS